MEWMREQRGKGKKSSKKRGTRASVNHGALERYRRQERDYLKLKKSMKKSKKGGRKVAKKKGYKRRSGMNIRTLAKQLAMGVGVSAVLGGGVVGGGIGYALGGVPAAIGGYLGAAGLMGMTGMVGGNGGSSTGFLYG
jgi:hypothetical protein